MSETAVEPPGGRQAQRDRLDRDVRARKAAAARSRQAAGTTGSAARSGAAAGSKAGPEGAAAGYVTGKAADIGRNAGRAAAQARVTPGDRAYQPVLLAEFLAAAVIVALAPVATGGSETARAKGGISPYDTGDLRQLVAVGAIYFVLALASSGNSGRVSAWFGGLILIGLTIAKLSRGQLREVFKTAAGQARQEEQQQGGAGAQ